MKNKIVLVLFCFSVSGCGGGSGSNTGSVEGYAYESIASSPEQAKTLIVKSAAPTGYLAVAGASVAVSGTATTATTNSEGYFKIDNVPQGTQTVTVTREGYTALQMQVSVTGGQTAALKTGSGEGAVISPKDNYFTLTQGNTWTYALTHTMTTYNTQGTQTEQITGTGDITQTVSGTKVINTVTTSLLSSSGTVSWTTGSKDTINDKFYLAWDTTTLSLYAQEILGNYTENKTPEKLLVLPLSQNATWTGLGLLFNASPSMAKRLQKMKNVGSTFTTKVITKETVTTSAGTFNCFKLQTTSATDPDFEATVWVAPIGAIKKTVTIKNIPVVDENFNPTGTITDSQTMELKSYGLK